MTATATHLTPGVHLEIPIEQYISDRAISKSDLHAFSQSPRKWMEREKKPPTKATIMGTAFHTAVLEPDNFVIDYVVADPKEVCPTALVKPRGSKKWKEYVEMVAPKVALTLDEHKLILTWRDAVLKHPAARKLLDERVATEETLCWERPNTAFPTQGDATYLCCSRPDFRTRASIVNLKSAASVKQFGWSRKDNGYDLDIGWSLEGASEVFRVNEFPTEYRWLVLFKDSLEVAVIKAAPDEIRRSRAQINAIWQPLCDALDHGVIAPRYPGEITSDELSGREEVAEEGWGQPE